MAAVIIINDNTVEVHETYDATISTLADSKAIFAISGNMFSVINADEVPDDDPLEEVVALVIAGLYSVNDLKFCGMNMDGYPFEYAVNIHDNEIVRVSCQGHLWYNKVLVPAEPVDSINVIN